MRFHFGVSLTPKKILKWLIPIAIGCVAFFGCTLYVNALEFEYPSSCTDSSITDYVECAISGYYEIESTDISSGCNIALGDPSTLNWRTRQVAMEFDYNVSISETNLTYNSNMLVMQQTARSNNGANASGFAVRFKRDTNDSPMYLSWNSYPLTSSVCQAQGSITCQYPSLRVYYCTDDTFSNCKEWSPSYNSYGESNELVGDLRFTSWKNFDIKTNSYLKNYYNTPNTDYNYIQINFSNTIPSDYITPPPINSGWVYYNIYLSSLALDTNELASDNEHVTNYCPTTGGQYVSGGGNSIIDNANQAIEDSINDLDPNLIVPYFNDLIPNISGLQGIITFPIDILNTIVANEESCTPYAINLSSITQRFGGFNYTLTLPCIRSKLQTLLGSWYEVFDLLIAGILFYYFASNLILKIHDTLSGIDNMPFFFTSSSGGRTTRPSLADITRERGHR